MLSIEFQAQMPYNTWALNICRKLDFALGTPMLPEERQRAKDICEAFEAAGWEVERFGEDTVCPIWTIFKLGAATFHDWTPDEAKANMAEARKILRRKFDLTRIPKRKLTLADMM